MGMMIMMIFYHPFSNDHPPMIIMFAPRIVESLNFSWHPGVDSKVRAHMWCPGRRTKPLGDS